MASSPSTSQTSTTVNHQPSNPNVTLVQATSLSQTNQNMNSILPKINIRLDGGNYPSWASYVHDTPMAFNLEHYVDQDNLEPPKYETQKDKDTIDDSSFDNLILSPKHLLWKREDKYYYG
ncbi:hypothetical protein Ancab_005514 [Ancistrocladus abbreviatus]